MRRAPTPPELTLWRALRAGQIDGLKFRRQAPIGPFVADFLCVSARLIVEVDGATHADSRLDAVRERWIKARGYRILRVWNNEVMGNLAGVLAAIREAATSPSPNPLP
jgi:very-short-patch-repair endonuclease